jgi:glycosyltransferase involved in cell wall biosynthesis
MANPKVEVSLIIPCFREGPTFEESVNKILKVLKKTRYKWEIIFVEDNSGDETRDTVERLTGIIKNASAIYHKVNQGRGKSVSDGVGVSRGKICGFLDVDLEVSAEYIPLFIAEVENGADLVIGKRFYEQTSSSVVRFVASKIYALLVRVLIDLPVSDTEAGYKFFKKKSIVPILSKTRDKKWFWDTEICARAYFANLKISQIPVLFVRRPEKKSTVRLIPDTWEYLIRLIQFRSKIPKLKKI